MTREFSKIVKERLLDRTWFEDNEIYFVQFVEELMKQSQASDKQVQNAIREYYDVNSGALMMTTSDAFLAAIDDITTFDEKKALPPMAPTVQDIFRSRMGKTAIEEGLEPDGVEGVSENEEASSFVKKLEASGWSGASLPEGLEVSIKFDEKTGGLNMYTVLLQKNGFKKILQLAIKKPIEKLDTYTAEKIIQNLYTHPNTHGWLRRWVEDPEAYEREIDAQRSPEMKSNKFKNEGRDLLPDKEKTRKKMDALEKKGIDVSAVTDDDGYVDPHKWQAKNTKTGEVTKLSKTRAYDVHSAADETKRALKKEDAPQADGLKPGDTVINMHANARDPMGERVKVLKTLKDGQTQVQFEDGEKAVISSKYLKRVKQSLKESTEPSATKMYSGETANKLTKTVTRYVKPFPYDENLADLDLYGWAPTNVNTMEVGPQPDDGDKRTYVAYSIDGTRCAHEVYVGGFKKERRTYESARKLWDDLENDVNYDENGVWKLGEELNETKTRPAAWNFEAAKKNKMNTAAAMLKDLAAEGIDENKIVLSVMTWIAELKNANYEWTTMGSWERLRWLISRAIARDTM